MAVSEAQRRSNKKHDAANFEYCTVKVRIGIKSRARDHAAARGESLNGFINRAIAEAMERDCAAAEPGEVGATVGLIHELRERKRR